MSFYENLPRVGDLVSIPACPSSITGTIKSIDGRWKRFAIDCYSQGVRLLSSNDFTVISKTTRAYTTAEEELAMDIW